MMINSIYTHKEIFLRELISNASDAIDKRAFRALTDSALGLDRSEYAIEIIRDKDARTLILRDNGCGMTQDELAVIKSAAKSPVTRFEPSQQANATILREEEEELDSSDSKWDKTILIASIAVILIGMAAILFAVFKFVDIFGTSKVTPTPGSDITPTKLEGTPVPTATPYVGLETTRLQNVVGRMVDDAKLLLYKQSDRFTILDGDTDYSDKPVSTIEWE